MAFVAHRQGIRRAAGRRPHRRRPRLHAGRVRHPRALRSQGPGSRLAADAAPHRLRARREASRSSTVTCWRTTPPCSACAGELGFTIAAEPDDPGVRRVRIGLGVGAGREARGFAAAGERHRQLPPQADARSVDPAGVPITCRSAPCRAPDAARDPNSPWTSPAAARSRADRGRTCAPPCRARRRPRRGSGSG